MSVHNDTIHITNFTAEQDAKMSKESCYYEAKIGKMRVKEGEDWRESTTSKDRKLTLLCESKDAHINMFSFSGNSEGKVTLFIKVNNMYREFSGYFESIGIKTIVSMVIISESSKITKAIGWIFKYTTLSPEISKLSEMLATCEDWRNVKAIQSQQTSSLGKVRKVV